jgi:hypothetical protein
MSVIPLVLTQEKAYIFFVALPDDRQRKRLLHMVSLLLPKYHRDTMEVLFVFLKWLTQFGHFDQETGSKMDLGYLAAIIGPSILKARSDDTAGDESLGEIRVVTALLEHQDEFWIVPEEFMDTLHDQEYFMGSMELRSKEFLNKIDTFMKIDSSNQTVTSSIESSDHGAGKLWCAWYSCRIYTSH